MKADDNRIIYDGLRDFGVKMWIKEGRLAFKYPDGIEGDNRKELYKFIKDNESGLLRILGG